MPLESLLELVETLRQRIDEHGAALRQSEALTRATLIDPLLRELGWDTEDPALVMPEYRLGRGYADYALLSKSKPMIMVEAKKLGASLQDAASQGIGYCIEDGIGYFAVTDGRLWEIYETHKMAPIAEKLTVQFDITQSPPITCLKAMALWRPAVEHGSVMAAETPIVGLDAIKPGVAEPIDLPPNEPENALQFRTTITEPNAPTSQTNELEMGNWVLLSDLNPRGGNSPPVEIQFPDNSRGTLGRWNTVLVETVRWLHTNSYLNAGNCRLQRASRYVVSNAPIHPNGKKFTVPSKVGELYVEINYSALNHVKNARMIIEHAGQDASQFKVRLR